MNWHQRIDEAEKQGGFSEEEQNLAQSWVTCACGQQDPRIPRYTVQDRTGHLPCEPKDKKLSDLGMMFAGDVDEGNFDAARATLQKIEQRAKELLGGV